MERDCMLAHGASSVILDRLFKQSDEFEAFVCRHCGLFGEHIDEDVGVCVQSRLFCRGCRRDGPESLARVNLPYSMKLLAQVSVFFGFEQVNFHGLRPTPPLTPLPLPALQTI